MISINQIILLEQRHELVIISMKNLHILNPIEHLLVILPLCLISDLSVLLSGTHYSPRKSPGRPPVDPIPVRNTFETRSYSQIFFFRI